MFLSTEVDFLNVFCVISTRLIIFDIASMSRFQHLLMEMICTDCNQFITLRPNNAERTKSGNFNPLTSK